MKVRKQNSVVHEITIENCAGEDLCELMRFAADYLDNEVKGEIEAINFVNDPTELPKVLIVERQDNS